MNSCMTQEKKIIEIMFYMIIKQLYKAIIQIHI